MSKFDTIISTKLEQLSEVAPAADPAGQQQTQQQQTQQQQTQQQQTQQQQTQQQQTPEAALAQALKMIKFTDAATAAKVMTTAVNDAVAGGAQGIKEFFGSVGYKDKFIPGQTQTVAPQGKAPPQAKAAAAPALA